VVDSRNKRLTWFRNAMGEGDASQSLPVLVVPEKPKAALQAVLRGSGAISSITTTDAHGKQLYTHYWHGRRGEQAQVISEISGAQSVARVKVGPLSMPFPQHFAARPFLAYSAESGVAVHIEQSIQEASGEALARLQLTWRGPGGERQTQTLTFPAVPLPSATVDSFLDAISEGLARGMSQSSGVQITPAMVRREVEKVLERPRYAPLVQAGAVAVDDDGRLWFRPHGTDEWRVVQAGSTQVGTVMLPPRARFLAARGNTLWIQTLDELDVPTLVRYRLD
jgi:hypothetical protein